MKRINHLGLRVGVLSRFLHQRLAPPRGPRGGGGAGDGGSLASVDAFTRRCPMTNYGSGMELP